MISDLYSCKHQLKTYFFWMAVDWYHLILFIFIFLLIFMKCVSVFYVFYSCLYDFVVFYIFIFHSIWLILNNIWEFTLLYWIWYPCGVVKGYINKAFFSFIHSSIPINNWFIETWIEIFSWKQQKFLQMSRLFSLHKNTWTF